MSEEETMDVLNWIPQLKSNNISMESTNIIKPRLLTILRLKYISTREANFKRMVFYFRILQPDSQNIVNQDMNGKGITKTNLPCWSNVKDIEFILKVSSQNCKCYVGFEEDVEFSIDVELKEYTTKKIMDIHVYYKT